MSKFSDNRVRRLRLRHLLPLGLLLLVPIVLAPAGSAKPPASTLFDLCVQNATSATPTPACSSIGAVSNFDGNSVATVQVTLTNDNASNVSIGSATLAVPPQLKLVADSGVTSSDGTVRVSGQTIKIQNLKLNKGQSVAATFDVDVACAGTADWSSSAQAFTSSDGTGTSFTLASSTGLSSAIKTACHLAFVNQPTDTQSGSGHKIADAGASQGGPVTVGLFDENGDPLTSCPVGYESGCSVDVASTPAGVTGTTTQPLAGGNLASFGDLSITNPALATQYNLTATGDGGFAPTVESASFLIAQTVTSLDCTGHSCSSQGQKVVRGTNLTDSWVEVSSTSGFDFMTLSPYTLGSPPQGCTGEIALPVTGFAESDGRQPGSGTLTIKYFVNKDILAARYGKNVGNQFTPICVGARRVNTDTGQVEDCTQTDQVGGSTNGWQGDAISAAGKFTGKEANAVCNADGYYWGIISSYQDKLDATQNPVVTNWTGQNIDGNNYREFDMSVPPGWDYRGGP